MSDQNPTRNQLARMLQQRLESLRASGLDWLPFSSEPISFPILSEEAEAMSEPEVAVDPEERTRHELQVLAEEISGCVRCDNLASTRTQTVFGTGMLNPDLCFIGEAPGADEDAQGEPFVGAAGQLLTNIIGAMGLSREEVYICNTIKCRPPGNRTPRIDEVHNCREYLLRQLELVNPAFLCALGGTAARFLLGIENFSVGRYRQRVLNWNGIPVVVTYHPAYLLPHRSNSQQEIYSKKKLVWDDMKFLLRQMGKPVPGEE